MKFSYKIRIKYISWEHDPKKRKRKETILITYCVFICPSTSIPLPPLLGWHSLVASFWSLWDDWSTNFSRIVWICMMTFMFWCSFEIDLFLSVYLFYFSLLYFGKVSSLASPYLYNSFCGKKISLIQIWMLMWVLIVLT